MVVRSLDGLQASLFYFCLSAFSVVVYLLIYTRLTPMNEYELLGKNVPNAAIGSWYAADALGGLSVREGESAITRAHRGSCHTPSSAELQPRPR
jgi:uncharacterized membrane protein YjfL (UPF0719 family)